MCACPNGLVESIRVTGKQEFKENLSSSNLDFTDNWPYSSMMEQDPCKFLNNYDMTFCVVFLLVFSCFYNDLLSGDQLSSSPVIPSWLPFVVSLASLLFFQLFMVRS